MPRLVSVYLVRNPYKKIYNKEIYPYISIRIFLQSKIKYLLKNGVFIFVNLMKLNSRKYMVGKIK